MEVSWDKKFSVGVFLGVLVVCVHLVLTRYNMLQKSYEPNGLDGYFYALQAKSLVQTGHLENPSSQCGYYLCGLCSYFTGDPITGVKLWSAISSAGISLAIFLLLGFVTAKHNPSFIGFLLSAASPTITQMGVNYINNQTGVMFLLFYVALLVLAIKKHPKSIPGKIALYSGALIFFVLSALSHKITLVFACLVTIVFALPVLIRLVKDNPSILLAVKLTAIVVFLVALIPAYRFFRLHSPRFANAFSLPSLPYFNAALKKSLGWGALEMSLSAVLLYILSIVMLVKKRPGRFLVLLVPAIFFPFLNLDSDMGLRLWMNAIPLCIPLEIYFVYAIVCKEDTVIAGHDATVIAGRDPAILRYHAEDNDGVSSYDGGRKTGEKKKYSILYSRLRTIVSFFIALICCPLYYAVYNFTPDFYNPESDPPYRYYEEVIHDIELDDDSLLIAHQPLNHVYTYEKNLRDALNWLPNFEVPVEKLWRLAYGTSESHVRNVLRSNDVLPIDSDDMIRKINYDYILIREDYWQKYLLLEEPSIVEALNNWYNPHEVRPDYIRKPKTKK
ncbi:MAG: hypothetical protein J5857_02675 [Treponema sp.]|nr:hypothetical protein [Treponema sp.]